MQQSTGKDRDAQGGGTQAPLVVATATPAVCPGQQGLERGVWGHSWAQARRCPHTHTLPQKATAAAASGVGWDEVSSELEVLLVLHNPSAVTAMMALGTCGTLCQPFMAQGNTCWPHVGPWTRRMQHQSRAMGNAMPTLLSTRTRDTVLGQKQPCMTKDGGHLTSPAQGKGVPTFGEFQPWREGQWAQQWRACVSSDPEPHQCSPWSLSVPRHPRPSSSSPAPGLKPAAASAP